MNVFLAGAASAIGRPLLKRLVHDGHRVTATTRSTAKLAELAELGATGVVLDAFDQAAVHRTITEARPEVVIHQLTSLPKTPSPRRMRAGVFDTGRIRRETVPVFARAAASAGARRFLVQSISFVTAPEGPPILDETAPLWLDGPMPFLDAILPVKDMEAAALGAPGIETLVLRYGFFYGPGTWYAEDGAITRLIQRRLYPDIGSGEGRMSFVHVEDAADVTALALAHGKPGIYNVTDSEPVLHREWLLEVAQSLGARAPRRAPPWLARILAGPVLVHYATSLRGASNEKARREFSWHPRSWREGFRQLYAGPAARA
jgi:nucleoside-diphosphate-sugar epimerase